MDFTAPLKVMKPFALENGGLKVMMLSASAGLMAGDTQEIEATVDEGALLELVSQSFDKVHRMPEGAWASRNCRLKVGPASLLVFAPQPVLPFAESAFVGAVQAHLADESSRLIYQDVIAAGRVVHGECFAYRSYRSRLEVHVGSELVFADNTIFEPCSMDLRGLCLYEGYTHFGSLLFVNCMFDEEHVASLHELAAAFSPGQAAFSQPSENIGVLRALGHTAENILTLLAEARTMLLAPGA
jgi:urease accessory protein